MRDERSGGERWGAGQKRAEIERPESVRRRRGRPTHRKLGTENRGRSRGIQREMERQQAGSAQTSVAADFSLRVRIERESIVAVRTGQQLGKQNQTGGKDGGGAPQVARQSLTAFLQIIVEPDA